jgi:GNAT superfamily N-acetyltransferase
MAPAPVFRIRPATVSDIDDLIRLRCLMFEAMGIPPDVEVWRADCVAYLEERLGTDQVGAFVAEADADAGGRLVGCGVGMTSVRMPGPFNLSGRYGYVASMATEPEWRGLGIARSIVVALLDWFVGVGVVSVDLHATKDGEPVYRSLGFKEDEYLGLRWRAHPLAMNLPPPIGE